MFTAINQLVARCASEQVLRWMIEVATVQPAAWVARQIEGNATITTSGSQLRAADGIINVRYGCEGSDVLMLLAAALIAAPIAWRRRLGGLLAGAAVVFVLNQARVLALFYAVRVGSPWFGPLHGLIAPLAVVLAVSLFFLWWIRRPLAAVGRV